ncbi:hypothetical protein H1C71_018350 [Ictidomys tridecemlineatus]|nr:hypothetical protein H1C71_018350 [Ictidomys tridecemlineatus]KAG3263362.1 hypothetical protein H1C71_018350 [Ictidomys tridecemlineatus]
MMALCLGDGALAGAHVTHPRSHRPLRVQCPMSPPPEVDSLNGSHRLGKVTAGSSSTSRRCRPEAPSPVPSAPPPWTPTLSPAWDPSASLLSLNLLSQPGFVFPFSLHVVDKVYKGHSA